MADMADMALDRACLDDMYLDEYCQGHMSQEEAYEMGFLDASGMETPGVESGWERVSLGGIDVVNSELEVALLNLDSAQYAPVESSRSILSPEAIDNLQYELPTCNICREFMKPQDGAFGKFYFCSCPGQKTVGDNYWQSIRRTL